ncbi:MAG TPA: IclR family transcriptional regulator [Nocardioidaceae bacterium]|nr:IclR family transcriptional regulator [Nocardioidaceae bacterium]
MSSTSVPGTQAVDRACALVSLVVHADEPLSFTDLADESGLARSTTSRLLAALERTDLLQRDHDGGYVSGPLFALYASRHDPWLEASRLVLPHLQHLRDSLGETVNLGVPQGDSVAHVAQVDSEFLLAPRDWTQVTVPPHSSALGKVLYAHGCLALPSDPLERCTEQTVPDVAALERELDRIRRLGYAWAVDELEVGLTAVAAPVYRDRGEVIAAVGVSGPTARLVDDLGRVGRLLVEHAERISALLRRRTHKEGAA